MTALTEYPLVPIEPCPTASNNCYALDYPSDGELVVWIGEDGEFQFTMGDDDLVSVEYPLGCPPATFSDDGCVPVVTVGAIGEASCIPASICSDDTYPVDEPFLPHATIESTAAETPTIDALPETGGDFDPSVTLAVVLVLFAAGGALAAIGHGLRSRRDARAELPEIETGR